MDTMTDDSTTPGPAGPDRLGPPQDAGPGRGTGPGAGGNGNGLGSPGAPGTPRGAAAPGPGHDPSAAAPDPVPLTRSRRHKVVAGVCGGLGRYFDIDPVIFRVVLAVLALTGGVGLLVYGMAWLFIPAQGEPRNEAQRLLSGRVEGPGMAAVLTSLAGCGVFLSTLGSDGGQPFPLFVIGAVLGAIFWSQRRRRHAAPSWAARGGTAATSQVADAPPAAQPPPSPGTPSWWKGSGSEQQPASGPRPYLWGPDDGTGPDTDGGGRHDGGRGQGDRSGPREPRSLLGFAVFCLASVAAVVGQTTSGSSSLGTTLQIGFACALAVFGGGLVLASVFGRARGGTVFLALVTTVLLAGSAALPKSVGEDYQERTWTPTSAADVQPSYELGMGRANLDLTRFDPKGETVRVRVEVGAGLVQVTIPWNVRADVVARSGVGVIQLPHYTRDDVDVSVNATRDIAFEPSGPAKQQLKGALKLDLEVGVGQVEVIRETP